MYLQVITNLKIDINYGQEISLNERDFEFLRKIGRYYSREIFKESYFKLKLSERKAFFDTSLYKSFYQAVLKPQGYDFRTLPKTVKVPAEQLYRKNHNYIQVGFENYDARSAKFYRDFLNLHHPHGNYFK